MVGMGGQVAVAAVIARRDQADIDPSGDEPAGDLAGVAAPAGDGFQGIGDQADLLWRAALAGGRERR